MALNSCSRDSVTPGPPLLLSPALPGSTPLPVFPYPLPLMSTGGGGDSKPSPGMACSTGRGGALGPEKRMAESHREGTSPGGKKRKSNMPQQPGPPPKPNGGALIGLPKVAYREIWLKSGDVCFIMGTAHKILHIRRRNIPSVYRCPVGGETVNRLLNEADVIQTEGDVPLPAAPPVMMTTTTAVPPQISSAPIPAMTPLPPPMPAIPCQIDAPPRITTAPITAMVPLPPKRTARKAAPQQPPGTLVEPKRAEQPRPQPKQPQSEARETATPVPTGGSLQGQPVEVKAEQNGTATLNPGLVKEEEAPAKTTASLFPCEQGLCEPRAYFLESGTCSLCKALLEEAEPVTIDDDPVVKKEEDLAEEGSAVEEEVKEEQEDEAIVVLSEDEEEQEADDDWDGYYLCVGAACDPVNTVYSVRTHCEECLELLKSGPTFPCAVGDCDPPRPVVVQGRACMDCLDSTQEASTFFGFATECENEDHQNQARPENNARQDSHRAPVEGARHGQDIQATHPGANNPIRCCFYAKSGWCKFDQCNFPHHFYGRYGQLRPGEICNRGVRGTRRHPCDKHWCDWGRIRNGPDRCLLHLVSRRSIAAAPPDTIYDEDWRPRPRPL